MPEQTPAQPQQFTPQEFAAKIKTKYPAYASMANDQLISKITEKYPQYKDSIKFDTSAQRGAAQATGLRPANNLTGKEGMTAALQNPVIKDLGQGAKAAGAAAEAEGTKAIAGLIGKAFKPAVKMVPVVSKLLDAQGNPIVREVEEVGKSAAGRAVGLTKEGVKNILKWMNANQLPTYLLFKTAEELGLAPHKALKMLHVASKE